MSNVLVDTTDLAAGTYNYAVITENFSNFVFQYKIISGNTNNQFEITFWGTVWRDAVDSDEVRWVDLTRELADTTILKVKNKTESDLSSIDSQIPLYKIKMKVVLTHTGADNTLEIAYNVNYRRP